MRTLIICQSIHHGNTKKVAEAMAKVLDAEVKLPSEVKVEDLANYDLIGLGSGIYFGRFHVSMLKLVKGLPDMADKKAFAFSTHGNKAKGWNKGFIKLLSGKGFNVLGDYECIGFDTWGPFKLIGGMGKGHPNEEDLNEAAAFAEKLKS
jgi:flavodoxin